MYVALLLDGTQDTVDKLNWHLSNGWGVVDRFEADTFVVVLVHKA